MDTIEQSAHDLILRRGSAAVDWLNERIDQLQGVHDMPHLDVTYRLLSAVERMLGEKARSAV